MAMMVVVLMLGCRLAQNYPQRVELAVDVARARTISAAARHVLGRRRALRQNTQKRRARRSSQLTRADRAVPDVEPLEQSNRGGGGHRQHTVRGLHRSIAQ